MQPAASQSIPYAEWSDEDLLFAYRSGRTRSFWRSWCAVMAASCSIISGGTGDADMAEDAFQATFLQVHMKCQYLSQGVLAVRLQRTRPSMPQPGRHQITSLIALFEPVIKGRLADRVVKGDTPSPDEHIETAEVDEESASSGYPSHSREVRSWSGHQGLRKPWRFRRNKKSRLHAAIRSTASSQSNYSVISSGVGRRRATEPARSSAMRTCGGSWHCSRVDPPRRLARATPPSPTRPANLPIRRPGPKS